MKSLFRSEDSSTNSGIESPEIVGDCRDICFDPVQHLLAVITHQGDIEIIEFDDDLCTNPMSASVVKRKATGSTFAEFVDGQGALVIITTDHTTKLIDLVSKKVIFSEKMPFVVTAVYVLNPLPWVLLGTQNGRLVLMDALTGVNTTLISPYGKRESVNVRSQKIQWIDSHYAHPEEIFLMYEAKVTRRNLYSHNSERNEVEWKFPQVIQPPLRFTPGGHHFIVLSPYPFHEDSVIVSMCSTSKSGRPEKTFVLKASLDGERVADFYFRPDRFVLLMNNGYHFAYPSLDEIGDGQHIGNFYCKLSHAECLHSPYNSMPSCSIGWNNDGRHAVCVSYTPGSEGFDSSIINFKDIHENAGKSKNRDPKYFLQISSRLAKYDITEYPVPPGESETSSAWNALGKLFKKGGGPRSSEQICGELNALDSFLFSLLPTSTHSRFSSKSGAFLFQFPPWLVAEEAKEEMISNETRSDRLANRKASRFNDTKEDDESRRMQLFLDAARDKQANRHQGEIGAVYDAYAMAADALERRGRMLKIAADASLELVSHAKGFEEAARALLDRRKK